MELFNIICGILGGGSFILTSLFAYFGNLQLQKYKFELAATNEKLKSFLERSIHVSKAQFDKEFSIYQEIWKTIFELRIRITAISLSHNSATQTESETDNRTRQIEEFSHIFSNFRNIIETNKPFYDKNVYDSLIHILNNLYFHSIESQLTPNDSYNNLQYNINNCDKIINNIDICCEIIRHRIASLSITQ